MSNINFANPWLLLILIPVILVLVIPFIITFKKDNIGIRNIMSLVLHILISTFIILVVAGMSYRTAVDQTHIYVLADTSYSANRNVDTIDSYINELNNKADNKTSVGVICFGNGTPYVLTTPGENIRSIRNAIDNNRVDQSGTDIAGALRYTASLFDDNVIKRIILITDGDDTTNGNILSTVNELYNQSIYVDAIYLDDNIASDEAEVQINGVNYTLSTYKDKQESVQITIQSNLAHRTSFVELLKDGEVVETRAPEITRGINIITMPLDTSEAGEFNYQVRINVNGDSSSHNNTYRFTQTVTENIKVLYLASNNTERDLANWYFEKENTEVTYLNIYSDSIPYTLEALCEYDVYVLSSVNVSDIRNNGLFIYNLDLMVSRYSKSLITLGNTYTQNYDDEYEYEVLSNMLPIRYGDSDRDGKLICLILDISKSMTESYHLDTAKDAAYKIIDLAQDSDNIMVYTMSGDTIRLQGSTQINDETRVSLKNRIDTIDDRQGTLIGSTIYQVGQGINNLPFLIKEIYLVSDGMTMNADPYNASEMALNLYNNYGINISTICIGNDASGVALMQNIANNAHGEYYTASDIADLEELFDNEISNNIGETVYNGGVDRNVTISRPSDTSLTNIEGNIEAVKGYYLGSTKNSAITVLETVYEDVTRNYDIPLYAYWRYGNGRVASFSCDINSSFWLSNWGLDSNGELFLQNLLQANLPEARVDAPCVIEVETISSTTYIYLTPPVLNPSSVVKLTLVDPNGNTVSQDFVYTTSNFQTSFASSLVGTYRLTITYELNNTSFETTYLYDVSYQEEYNSFNYYELSNLNHMVNNGNPVYENASDVDMSIDETKSTTYSYDFTVLFMTIAICLFVVDIFIRKVKWADIKQIFVRKH